MTRPRIYDEKRVTTAVRLTNGLRERLRDEAARRDVSMNYLIQRAVEQYLDRLSATTSGGAP